MNLQSFSQQSQAYISGLISGTSFNLEDPQSFSMIKDPYQLGPTRYQIYNFRALTGYKPNKDRPEPVLYTFFILRPLDGVKERFLEEVGKKGRGEQYDQNIIAGYYTPLHPAALEMKALSSSLGQMLSDTYFTGKGYSFISHLVTVTKDYDVALVFLEMGSVKNLEAVYPEEVIFNL